MAMSTNAPKKIIMVKRRQYWVRKNVYINKGLFTQCAQSITIVGLTASHIGTCLVQAVPERMKSLVEIHF